MKCKMKNVWLVRTLRGSEYRIILSSNKLSTETLSLLEDAILVFDATEKGQIQSAELSGWCLTVLDDGREID
jgi:hypothetical protein